MQNSLLQDAGIRVRVQSAEMRDRDAQTDNIQRKKWKLEAFYF